MALPDPAKISRDALLDELDVAVSTWYAKETEAITKEEQFVKSIIKARSSGSLAGAVNVAQGRVLVIDDIGSFLTGV
jgi:hypothetical protein